MKNNPTKGLWGRMRRALLYAQLMLPLLLALSIVHCQLSVVFAQGEANNWYFGNRAGLTFNTQPPTALTDGQLSTSEGCVTISDKNGNLLFYTDGIRVWNKSHQQMFNGSNLKGGPSSTQSGIVVPKPGSETIYYIVTVPQSGSSDQWLCYSVVDMDGDSGRGAVTSKNNEVFNIGSASEKVAAVAHANGIDYWVISYEYSTGIYHAFLVTCDGFAVQHVPSITVGANRWGGYLVGSPDGKMLAAGYHSNYVDLFDFDNSTGILSNKRALNFPGGNAYGVAFSPNSKVLYVAPRGRNRNGSLRQWDLTDPTVSAIEASAYNVSTNDAQGALQLAPDGKIYAARNRALDAGITLPVIHNPDVLGPGCNYGQGYVSVAPRWSTEGLPPFVSSFFAPPVQISGGDDAQAKEDAFDFSVTCQDPAKTTVKWDFGDGTTGTGCDVEKTYANDGIYTVTATVTTKTDCGDVIDTLTKQVVVGHGLHISPANGETICPGEPVQLQADNPDGQPLSWSNDQDPNWPAQNGQGAYTITPTEATTYTVGTKVRDGNTNLIANGDFEADNTGFDSQYQHMPGAFNGQHGVYGVGSDPKPRDPAAYITLSDHTPGQNRDKMLIVEGVNTPSPGMYFWRQTVQSTVPGGEYVFSAWFTHLRTGGNRSATVRVFINGHPVGDITVTTHASGLWQRLRFNWTADGTAADIRMEEISGVQHNDFAVDDISLYPLKDETKTITVTVNKEEAPTGDAVQVFCPRNDPYTLADLVVAHELPIAGQAGTGFLWYDAATGGTALPSSAHLADGTTYHAAQVVELDGAACEGADRLAVQFRLNNVAAGSVQGGGQPICAGGTPGPISSLADAAYPSDATVKAYQWHKREAGGPWEPITGADQASHQPGALSATTEYKRVAVSELHGRECAAESNTVRVEVVSVPAPDLAQTEMHACEPGATDKVYTVAWLRPNGPDIKWWSAQTGGTEHLPTDDLDPAKEYWASQLVVSNGIPCWSVGRTKVKFVRDIEVDAGAIKVEHENGNLFDTHSICWPNPGQDGNGPTAGTLVSHQSGTVGGIYTWHIIRTSGNPEAFANGLDRQQPYINVDADYLHPHPAYSGLPDHANKFVRRATVTDHGETCWKDTDPVYIRVRTVDGGTLKGAQAICANTNPTALETDIASGSNTSNSSSFSYNWEYSADNGASFVPNQSSDENYTPSSANGTRIYRRKTEVSGQGFPGCFAYSNNTVTIRVRQGGTDGCKIILDKRVSEKPGRSNGNGIAEVGETLTYTIEVLGQYDRLEKLTVVDRMPAHTTFRPGSLKLFRDGSEITPLPISETVLYDNSTNRIRWEELEVPIEHSSTVPSVTQITFDVTVDNTDLTGVERIVNTVDLDDLSAGLAPHVPVSDRSADVSIKLEPKKGFDATKTVTGGTGDGGKARAGDVLAYAITVKNEGNVNLDNVVVTDILPDGLDAVSMLDNGSIQGKALKWTIPVVPYGDDRTVRFTASVVDDLTGIGQIKNTAEVVFESMLKHPTENIYADPQPRLKLFKSADRSKTYGLDERIPYTITVGNTGSEAVNGIKVEDPDADTKLVGAITTLGYGKNSTPPFTAFRTVTQDDVDRGYVANLATASGTGSSGKAVSEESEDPDGKGKCSNCPAEVLAWAAADLAAGRTVVPVRREPGKLSVTKEAVSGSVTKEGDRIEYKITVRNTGRLTLKDIDVTDHNADGGPNIDRIAKLKPGDSKGYTVFHTVTQDEVNAGRVDNTAIATGKDPQDKEVSATSVDPNDPGAPATTVEIPRNPGMEVKKTVDRGKTYGLNSKIEYSITVKNTGNTTLTNIVLTDPDADHETGKPWERTIAKLEPGDPHQTFTAYLTVQQHHVDAGAAGNVAFAAGESPSDRMPAPGKETIYESSEDPDKGDQQITEVDVDQGIGGRMEVVKRVTSTGPYQAAGDRVEYEIVVRNTGDVTLRSIDVADPNSEEKSVGVILQLAPGASTALKATHIVTQDDVDAGFVKNVATASGQAPNGRDVTDITENSKDPNGDPETTVEIVRTSGMEVEKIATNNSGKYKLGEKIEYAITVTNVGDLTLTDIDVSDPNADAPNVWKISRLAPTKDTTIRAWHRVTLDDLQANLVENIAVAKGKDPQGAEATAESTDPDCAACPSTAVPLKPGMTVIKEVADRDRTYGLGDRIEYKIVVKNTGNAVLTDITVLDDNADDRAVGHIPSLAVGESRSFTAWHTVDQGDLDRGHVHNIALAGGKDPNGGNVSESSTAPVDYGDPKDPNCPTCTAIKAGHVPLDAHDDAYMVMKQDGAWATVRGRVLDNDLFDGQPVDPAKMDVTVLETPEAGLQLEHDGAIRVSPVLRLGRYSLRYRVCEVKNPTNCSEAVAVVDVLSPDRQLLIPNVFTPNGDGVNDTFEILGLPNFDRISLRVFTRYGEEVYVNEDYQNDWDANSPQVLAGTYFYTIEAYRDGGQTEKIKGWVTIMRRNLE